MEDGHSCPSHGHETRSKHWLLDLDSRSIMRSCVVNISDMNVQATEIAAMDGIACIFAQPRPKHSPKDTDLLMDKS